MENCIHEWQHVKFVVNTTEEFTLCFYCKKCLEFKLKTYPPIKRKGWVKEENE